MTDVREYARMARVVASHLDAAAATGSPSRRLEEIGAAGSVLWLLGDKLAVLMASETRELEPSLPFD
jgi:hypothetical protein